MTAWAMQQTHDETKKKHTVVDLKGYVLEIKENSC
jgi:hypothetical protein